MLPEGSHGVVQWLDKVPLNTSAAAEERGLRHLLFFFFLLQLLLYHGIPFLSENTSDAFKVINDTIEFRSAVLLFSVCSHCFLFQFSVSCIACWSIFMTVT